MPAPRVFNIPASVPFLQSLLEALFDGRVIEGFPASVGDTLALADLTIYLPTRRACRLARDAFLDLAKGEAAILPRIVAIGDVDEDEVVFEQYAAGDAALDLPPAISGLERRLRLVALVAAWSARVAGAGGAPLVAANPAATLTLADDLARLIDDMTTRQVSWDKLDDLVPDEFDEYWQRTLEFLKIARSAWPAMLAERGAVDPSARRDLLIEAETKRLGRSNAPVIAAGSTGSMPATATLLTAIAKLPHGAVVLPGLDTHLDDASWKAIADDGEAPAAGHPQYAMQALLKRIGIARDSVIELAAPAAHGRERLVSEALRPAMTTDQWRERLAEENFAEHADEALRTLTVIEAANAEEEALTIAVALRETAQTLKTAALITPDRALARRVVSALKRWNVPVDDSGGDALPDTQAGVFARLVAEAALGDLPPVALLALLKHPLLRLGGKANVHANSIAALERALLRGPRPRAGTNGLAHALAALRDNRANLHRSDPRLLVTQHELDAAAALIEALRGALAPLEALPETPLSFAALTGRHRDALAALSTGNEGGPCAMRGADGRALELALDEIVESDPAKAMIITPADYPELLQTALADRAVRRPELRDVRIRILGPLEARLQEFDRVILGGLVEGNWPPETRSDPWLSRPMRHNLGLDLPERRIGLSAHDFAQALGAKEVFLTRAAKLSGAPTVLSRFPQRLAAVAGDKRWKEAIARGENYLAWARALDAPQGPPKPAERPAPKPPRAARPLRLSVTAIEDWLRDPYTIYAKHILNLRPLDAVDTPPGARDRGTVIHGAIGDFTKDHAAGLPDDPYGTLIALGRAHFAKLDDYPEARAFWWPRFERIARWFTGTFEHGRRKGAAAMHAEIRGTVSIPLDGDREFILSGIADRIERLTDGGYAILDYKTGSARTEKEVRTGMAPQLTLEAAILRRGGFEGIADGASVSEIVYVTLKGGEPPGDPCAIDFKEGNPDSQADNALAKLRGIISRFEQETQGYTSLVHPKWRYQYGDYDHLARVKEWAAFGGVEEEIP